jgi:hypothetical protein
MNSFVNSVFRICEKKWVEIYGKYSSFVTDKKMDLNLDFDFDFNIKKNMIFDIEAQQFVGENYLDWKYRNLDNDEESKIIILIDY